MSKKKKGSHINENITFNYSESLEQLAINTINLLNNKVYEYMQLFNVEKLDHIVANYFDNLEEFRNFIYNLRGEKESLPEYARGTYDNGMINVCVDKQNQMNRLYTASHELFHILYMKYILKDNYDNRIVWYDEGMAQFISGEKNKLLDDEEFANFYKKVKEETKQCPNLNDLVHGEKFCNEYYDGYKLSYLCVRYLSEILSNEDFKKLMADFDMIKEYGVNIINDMFEYYDEKYLKNKLVKS